MEDKIPTLTFTVISPDKLPGIGELFTQFTQDELLNLDDRYTVIAVNEQTDYTCVVYNIMENDITGENRLLYDSLISCHGETKVNTIVYRDDQRIREKIISIVNFVFNITKSNTLEVVYRLETDNSVPAIIMETIADNFNTVADIFLDGIFTVRITKREE